MNKPPRIKQLDNETIGHIAAGEVVERPAQVVKELLENSLDAQAKQIDVIIERGGFDLIAIADNGVGISEDDIALSVDRHATSKLNSFDDLNEIYTMGFRGEALASIGMVSELSVASKTRDGDGKIVSVHFGKKSSVESHGMSFGTTVTVQDLFKNTPARLSFQRRPATENAKIVDVIISHAIANNSVGFKLVSDQKTILNIPASETTADRLYDILGGQASELIELNSPAQDSEVPGDEHWHGWISTPDITRGKGDEVYVLINDRPVASGPFHQAIRRGYKTRLMQGRHPIAVLSLNLPASEVDVNVHPTKREVRLKHSWRVLERLERAIAHTLEDVITEITPDGSIPGISSTKSSVMPIQDSLKQDDIQSGISVDSDIAKVPAWAIAAGTQLNLSGSQADEIKKQQKPRPVSISEKPQETLPGLSEQPISPALSKAERDIHKHSPQDSLNSPLNDEFLRGMKNTIGHMEPLAQFADSYIIVQSDDELLLIDQHALHERIRYERLKHSSEEWVAQSLISPVEFELSLVQKQIVQASIEKLAKMGFNISVDDQKISILSHPLFIKGQNIEQIFIDLLQDLSEDGAPLETVDNLRSHIALMNACRGAIKANQKLSIAEMRRLIDDMTKIPNPWACIHGRPTAMRINIDSLDHHFGRDG
ncbi:MAG: DNA mismatch repair endonuclease MutL [Candidatus Thermoplasmatota archaeon]|nr:DNA mismatch repair endonuclease MutL [Candidatus Thermoplasmatota archaeon]